MKLTKYQKKLLNKFVDKYEGSKTYTGTNQVNQGFYVTPDKIWSEYYSDYADVNSVEDFNDEMWELASDNLIKIKVEDDVIIRLAAINEQFEQYYKLLGREEKNALLDAQKRFYQHWLQKDIPIVNEVCVKQLARIDNNKKSEYELDVIDDLFKILEFIQNNQDEILERDLSILLFGDSKKFQNNYRSRLCKLIKDNRDFNDFLEGIENSEQDHLILEEYHIVANPSYVYLKGSGLITFNNGDTFNLQKEPLALSNILVKEINSIKIFTGRIVTVENLTSFHNVKEDDCTYIYLAGYHNSLKQKLIKRIYEENENKGWYHFGDIDPDGFYILENLKRGTGIDFQPLNMAVEQLIKYRDYCKPLEKNDITKANNLIAQGKYVEIMNYMLENNSKLEQEIMDIIKA